MRPKKKLPEYDDVIFLDFESARIARASMMDALKLLNRKHPESKHFMSVADFEFDIYGTKLDYKIAFGYPADNRRYGWYKRPGIYEVENGNPSAGYIFEEPVLLT